MERVRVAQPTCEPVGESRQEAGRSRMCGVREEGEGPTTSRKFLSPSFSPKPSTSNHSILKQQTTVLTSSASRTRDNERKQNFSLYFQLEKASPPTSLTSLLEETSKDLWTTCSRFRWRSGYYWNYQRPSKRIVGLARTSSAVFKGPRSRVLYNL